MLKKFGTHVPGAEGVLEEELAKVSKGKKGIMGSPEETRSAETTPKKRKLGPPVRIDMEEDGDEL